MAAWQGRRGRGRTTWWAALGGLLVLLALHGSEAAKVATPEASVLVGHLTWKSGQGAISWNPNATTEAAAGDPLPGATCTGNLVVTRNYCTDQCNPLVLNPDQTSRTCPGPTIDFLSEPVPVALLLNVSRSINVSILRAPIGLTFLSIELTVDGEWLAGGECSGAYSCRAGGSPADDGTSFYAMHSEMAAIRQGAILRLRVITENQERPYRIDLSNRNMNWVRIPYFSSEEAIFRLPNELGPTGGGVDVSPSSQGSTTPAMSSSLGMSALAFMVPKSLKGVRPFGAFFATFALAGSALLAGCLGHAAGSNGAEGAGGRGDSFGGRISSTAIGGGENDLRRGGLGAIAGLVVDDLGGPVDGAHVSLLETDLFAQTNVHGTFILRDLTPRNYTMRIEAAEFKTLQDSVLVPPDQTIRIKAHLLPKHQVEDGGRLHVHDYWGASDVYQMGEGDVASPCYRGMNAFGGDPAASSDNQWHCDHEMEVSNMIFPRLRPEDGLPNLVMPATYDVEVRVDLVGQGHPERVTFGAEPANAITANSPVYLYPKQSGVTNHFRSSWELDDRGHQLFTFWRFWLSPVDAAWSKKTDRSDESWHFHVRILLHKGALPLEPAHRDFWQGKESLRILQADEYRSTTLAGGGTTTCAAENTLLPALNCRPSRFSAPVEDWSPLMREGGILVPPGTRWLEFVQRMDDKPTAPSFNFDKLQYKPANVPEYCTGWGYSTPSDCSYCPPEFRQAGCVRDAPPGRVSADQTSYSWRFEIQGKESDDYYAVRSNWQFWTSASDGTSYEVWSNLWGQHFSLNMTVIAHSSPL